MMRSLVCASALLMCARAAFARAGLVRCSEDGQCFVDSFCETASHECQPCIHCESLKREPPQFASSSACIQSVSDCGSCLKGLMVSHVDVNGECIPPDPAPTEHALSVYIWLIIGFVVFCVLAMIGILIFVLIKKDILSIYTNTFLGSPSCTSTNMRPSAPEPPPPYDNQYTAVRPDSPYNMSDLNNSLPTDEETSRLFVKRAPSSVPAAPREADGNQNAICFNAPSAYVRVPPQGPPLSDGEDSSTWPPIHNEDTTPHEWTPNTSTHDTNGNTVGEVAACSESAASEGTSSNLPALLAAARNTTLVAPPAKKPRIQDSNNNGHRGSDDDGPGGGPSAAIVLNIVQINNTKL